MIAANSITATVEEKLDALQYLTDHYEEEDFAKESVNVGPGHAVYHSHLPSREDVRETIISGRRRWKTGIRGMVLFTRQDMRKNKGIGPIK